MRAHSFCFAARSPGNKVRMQFLWKNCARCNEPETFPWEPNRTVLVQRFDLHVCSVLGPQSRARFYCLSFSFFSAAPTISTLLQVVWANAQHREWEQKKYEKIPQSSRTFTRAICAKQLIAPSILSAAHVLTVFGNFFFSTLPSHSTCFRLYKTCTKWKIPAFPTIVKATTIKLPIHVKINLNGWWEAPWKWQFEWVAPPPVSHQCRAYTLSAAQYCYFHCQNTWFRNRSYLLARALYRPLISIMKTKMRAPMSNCLHSVLCKLSQLFRSLLAAVNIRFTQIVYICYSAEVCDLITSTELCGGAGDGRLSYCGNEAVLYASPVLFVGRLEGNANGGPDECSDAKQIWKYHVHGSFLLPAWINTSMEWCTFIIPMYVVYLCVCVNYLISLEAELWWLWTNAECLKKTHSLFAFSIVSDG